MEMIGKYLLRIVIVAAICGIANAIVSEKRASGGIIRLITGIFVAVTVIAPLANLDFADFGTYTELVTEDADAAAQAGAQIAKIETGAIIKEQLEAYILDKAESLHLTVSVNIEMTDSYPSLPYSVQISGTASPYNKKVLSSFIATELSIPEERQIWK